MTRFLAVVSGKGGTGKTTVSINLTGSLKQLGRDVILLDSNLQTPNISLHLGLPILPVTFNDVLRDNDHIKNAVYKHQTGIKLIPCSIALKDLKGIKYNKIPAKYKELEGLCELVVIDCSPGLSEDLFEVLKGVDDVLVVTNPDLPSLTDSLRLVKMLHHKKINILGIVLNLVHGHSFEISLNNARSLVEKEVIGSIPYDHNVRKAIRDKTPIVFSNPKSKAAIEFRKLAHALIENEN